MRARMPRLMCHLCLPPPPLVGGLCSASLCSCRQHQQSRLLTFFCMFVLPLCLQAGIEYEYESLEAALPKKAKKTKFED
jgi:hypothetical protein